MFEDFIYLFIFFNGSGEFLISLKSSKNPICVIKILLRKMPAVELSVKTCWSDRKVKSKTKFQEAFVAQDGKDEDG